MFIWAAAVFVGGAIGVEMISGYQADLAGERNLTYALIISVEELCEMLGVVIFIHALMTYLQTQIHVTQIHIHSSHPVPVPVPVRSSPVQR